MVYYMAADDLFCKLAIGTFIFIDNQEEHTSKPVFNAEVLGVLLHELFPYEHNNF